MFNQEYREPGTGIETICVCEIFYHHGAGKTLGVFINLKLG